MEATMRPANARPSPTEAPEPQPERRLVIGIPTTGRREILTTTVQHIAKQTRLPDLVVLSVAQERDIDRASLLDLPFPIQVIVGPRGLSVQRNRVLEQIQPADVVLFLDDDFLMTRDYLHNVLDLFSRHPDIVMATGQVIADGVVGRGYDHQTGLDLLKGQSASAGTENLCDVYNGYGCNMAIRARPVLAFNVAFDERLPLYSWLEDVDFSRQLADYGRLVRSDRLCGVHLGTKTGRTPGKRLGYSQIVNPVYMARKGTVSVRKSAMLTGRVLVSNIVYSVRPRKWTDSRGRLKGNFRAIADILRGRITPERAKEF